MITIAKKFYITTPIYYVNAPAHIGHAYTTIAADILARWHRLKGEDVFFLTGTDEHGQKIEDAAKEKGTTPNKLVDSLVPIFKKTWEKLNISYDYFIRTSDKQHEKIVIEVLRKLIENDDIYKGEYEGWYCVPDETYWTKLQLKDGKCPNCSREVTKLKEDAYFFRLSKYEKRLLDFYNKNPDFMLPDARRNEMLGRIKEGLKDICITRKTVKWAIPFPGSKDHYVYVWVEALQNYITALGYPDGEKFKKYWPADLHLIGKEINWFHSVVWPAMLFAIGIEPPKKVFAHGWWTVEGQKMSKSLGNVVDPIKIADKYGVDVLRYYLFRSVPFGEDGDFSEKALINRINGELADQLGNLVNRVLVLIEKSFKGEIPFSENTDLKRISISILKDVEEDLDKFLFHESLNHIWFLVAEANKYIDMKKPWNLEGDELADVLYNLIECIRLIALILNPFMPETSEKILRQIGIEKISYEDFRWGLIKSGAKINREEVLFKKVEK